MAQERTFSEVFRNEDFYAEVRLMARRKLRRDSKQNQVELEPEDLVSETFIRLAHHDLPTEVWHQLAIINRTMRSILIDRARMRHSQKRGEGKARVPVEVAALQPFQAPSPEAEFAVTEALANLRTEGAVLAQIAELKYFVGLTDDEVAATLGISFSMVRRAWSEAKDKLKLLLR